MQADTASCSSGSSESDRDETWDDYGADGEDQLVQPATSLFDQTEFPDAQQALAHDKHVHGVDLPLLAATLGELSTRPPHVKNGPGTSLLTHVRIDFFERIRLINWIRQTVSDRGRRPPGGSCARPEIR